MPEPATPEVAGAEPAATPKLAGRWGNLVTVALVTAAVLGGVWVFQKPFDGGGAPTQPSASAAASGETVAVGTPAPDFTGTLLDGNEFSLAKLRGKPVWLVFGATWCANCRAEAPDVEALSQEFAGRAAVVAIYLGEDTATVQGYAERTSAKYPQLADPTEQIGAAYQVSGFPKHFFVDSTGVIRKIRVGVISPADARAELSALEN